MIVGNVYEKPFTIRLPDRSEWKEGFEPDRKGGTNLVYRWFQNQQRYWSWSVLIWKSRRLSFNLGQYTVVFQVVVYAIKACADENIDRNYKIGTSIFCQTVKQQLKHLTNTRSPQNWSGTATNSLCIWPNITEFN
jgi:hypothetical protein